MPHAWNFDQLRPRDIRRRVAAGLDRHERIIRAVNDNRRRLDPFERRAAIAVDQCGSHLPGKARRIIRPLEILGHAPAYFLFVSRIARAADRLVRLHASLNGCPTSPAGGRFSSTAIASRFAKGSALFPVEDMIEVNESVLPGWFAATSCPIAPPNDAPTICARSIRSASSSPAASLDRKST